MRHTLPLISMHDSSREGSQPSLFLPPLPLESKRLRAFQQRLVIELFSIEVGEHGSSSLSPDWWMACLTLSEQDGRCVGWDPEIVTPDCFIRAWLIELSSSWSKVPRHLVQPFPHSCLSCGHPETLGCLPAWLASRLPPTHPGTDTLTNWSRYTCSWVLGSL